MAAKFFSEQDLSLPNDASDLADLDTRILDLQASLPKQFPNFTNAAATPSIAEINRLVGVTSDLQPQINTKRALFSRKLVSTGGTAVSGEYILANTSVAGFTYNLPVSPTAGMAVGFKDITRSWAVGGSKNLTIGRNGKEIEGFAENLICDWPGAAFVLLYVDDTYQWRWVDV